MFGSAVFAIFTKHCTLKCSVNTVIANTVFKLQTVKRSHFVKGSLAVFVLRCIIEQWEQLTVTIRRFGSALRTKPTNICARQSSILTTLGVVSSQKHCVDKFGALILLDNKPNIVFATVLFEHFVKHRVYNSTVWPLVTKHSVNTALWITMFDLNCLLQQDECSHFVQGSFAVFVLRWPAILILLCQHDGEHTCSDSLVAWIWRMHVQV